MRTSSDLEVFGCDHFVRINAKSYKVNDIVFFDDGQRNKVSINYWADAGTELLCRMWIHELMKPIVGNTVAIRWLLGTNALALA